MGDAAAIYHGYASDPDCTRYVSWPTHQSISETLNFLKMKADDWNEGKDYAYGIIKKSSGELIGGLGAINEKGKVAIGYILNKNFEGRGYTTEAVKGLTQLLLVQPDIWRIWALCDNDNIGSHRVLEKSGFQKEAILRQWYKFINQNNTAKDCVFYIYIRR